MKTVVACVLIAALASLCTLAPARAESVFDAFRAGPPRLSLDPTADARNSGISGAMAIGETVSPVESGTGVSPLKAGLSSLMLPGLGEQKLGHTLRAKVFFGLEAAGWISVASFLWAGYSRERSYKDYAVAFAGVSGTDHPDDYYKTIGRYMTSDGVGGYNESVRQDARDLYYPDVEAMDSYYSSYALTGVEGWSWRNEAAYQRYGSLRDGSRFAYRVALYSAVGLAALRIVSAADAVRLSRVEGRPAANEGATSMGFEAAPQSVALFVQRSF
ncbi:MAG: hypothetical protein PHD74_01125 [Candidatus Krumholzibacteria bacterium]|nr:hypothetical protein [Candidatus Krumholzibacteria bacterium]